MRLLSLLFAFFASLACQAQNDTIASLVDDIVIAANRIEVRFSENSRSIQFIKKEQIEELNATSIAEVLQTVIGVDVRQRGINGVQSDLSIRGGTFEQVLILVNGIKIIDPQTGHHLMNIPFSLDDVERIEVLKGPSARIYGANAFTGAVNIITKPKEEIGATVKLETGSFGLLNTYGSVSLPISKLSQQISFSRESSDGYRENSDYKIYNALYNANYKNQNGSLNVLAGYTDRDFGANGFYGRESFTEQFETVQTLFTSLAYEQRVNNIKLSPKLSYRKNKDNWQFRRSDPSFFQNFHTTNVLTAELHAHVTHGIGILGVGFEYNDIEIESSNLSNHHRDQLSFYLENRLLFFDEKLDLTPGILVLNISDFGTKAFPGIDIGYALNRNFKLYANAGSTARVPTYTDLYYEDSGNVGNPNLKEEVAFTTELGFKYLNPRMTLSASVFNRRATDQIDWFRVNEGDKWMPENFNKANYLGFELTTHFKWGSSTNINGSFDLSYSYLNATFEENDFAFSRNALENLKHQVIVSPVFNFRQFELTINARYNDRVSLDDYFVLDVNINYSFKKHKIFLKAYNISDARYRETNLVEMPGRWMKLGFKANL